MGNLSSTDGDNPGMQDYQESTLEQKTNKENRQRLAKNGHQRYPMCMHKPHGLTKKVENESEEQAAAAKGWYDDIRNVPMPDAPPVDTTLVSQMPIDQALAFVATAKVEDLAAIEADEASHGNRAKVIEAIEAAKDAIGGEPVAPVKTAAPKVDAKKKPAKKK